jgi:hypothetical protein
MEKEKEHIAENPAKSPADNVIANEVKKSPEQEQSDEIATSTASPRNDNALTVLITELQDQLAARETELSEAKKSLDAQAANIATLKTGSEAAVAAYRKLAVSSNPIFTDELITGNTIQEVDASIQRVNGLAAGIKTKLEAELKATIIPAGAPERSGPDTSGLSPREKIKAGIQSK